MVGCAAFVLALATATQATWGDSVQDAGDYREPAPAVTALLTAPTPPEPLLHAGSGQIALLFVGDAQVVEGVRVSGIDLGGAVPPVDRFTPQPALGHGDAEFHLLTGVSPRIGVGGRGKERRQQGEHDQSLNHRAVRSL